MGRDLEIRRLVMDELEWEPSVDAAHIGVIVDDGIVTLTGHVPTYREKLAAEQAARRVRGVRAVAQEVVVQPSATLPSDEEIAERALKVLAWDAVLPRDRLAISVEQGTVTLRGELDWQFQRDLAVRDVLPLHGVIAVVDATTLRPRADDSLRPLDPATVRQGIERALERLAGIDADQIAIDVVGGKVTLAGKTYAWIEREAAERAAWSIPGVTQVENRIIVSQAPTR